METFLEPLTRVLLVLGPWIVFVVCLVETAFFLGLIIPAEATVLIAAFLAESGKFSLLSVFVATLFGALAGDQIGYALGRFGGGRVVAKESGRIGRMWHRHQPAAERMFKRHAVVSVTLARFISFVRTLMPWFAGMTRMPYPKYLLFDFLGVLGWTVASIALGYAAGESWHRAANALGTVSALVLTALIIVAVIQLKRRRSRAQIAD